jgi:hypothetical protein
MQLKLQRSQRDAGVMSKTVIFCLDARVTFTDAEAADIKRYKMEKQVIYNSEAARRLLDKSQGQNDGSAIGGLKSLATLAMAAMNLNISIGSLRNGQHVECKSMEELLGTEEAIMTACQNLKGYLGLAATFDGREVVVDFDQDEPTVTATAPAPLAIAPPQAQAALPRTQAMHRTADPVLAGPDYVGSSYSASASTAGGPSDLDRVIAWFNERTRPARRRPILWACVVGGVLGLLVLGLKASLMVHLGVPLIAGLGAYFYLKKN